MDERIALVRASGIRKRGYSIEEDEEVLQDVGGAVLFVPNKVARSVSEANTDNGLVETVMFAVRNHMPFWKLNNTLHDAAELFRKLGADYVADECFANLRSGDRIRVS